MSKILIIEDDDTIRTIMHRTLTEAGHLCFSAAEAAGGWELGLREKPDLILLDVVLPDGNGISLCRRVKAEEKVRGARVILVTGVQTEAESRAAGLEAGADDYIIKPFRIGELVARVHQVLGQGPKPAASS